MFSSATARLVRFFLLLPLLLHYDENCIVLGAPGPCNQGLEKLTATSTPGYISSPNYPNDYVNNDMCRWVILANENYQVIKFRIVDVELMKSSTCTDDYLEVRDGFNSWSPTLKKWCGTKGPGNGDFSSTDSSILVTFRSNKAGVDRGFKLQFWAEAKGRKEWGKVEFRPLNYVIFAFFAFLVFGLGLSLVGIYYIRKRRAERNVEESEMREKARLKRMMLERKSYAFVNPAADLKQEDMT